MRRLLQRALSAHVERAVAPQSAMAGETLLDPRLEWRPSGARASTSSASRRCASRLTARSPASSRARHQSPREAFFRKRSPNSATERRWGRADGRAPADGNGRRQRRLRAQAHPPMLALQAEWIETGKMLLIEQAPLAPAYAFNGEVKRSEWYSAVSPGLLERSFCQVDRPGGLTRAGQRRRWISPLPTRFGGDASEMPPLDDLSTLNQPGSDIFVPEEVVSTSVQYVRRPSQLLAMRPIKQAPSNELVLSTAVEIAASAERAGLKVARREGRPVIMQVSGDVSTGSTRGGS